MASSVADSAAAIVVVDSSPGNADSRSALPAGDLDSEVYLD